MSTGQFGPGPSPQRSGGGGMSLLVIILIILGVLALACAGICGGCAYLLRDASRSGMAWVALTPAMDRAVSAVSNDPQVIGKLGEPVEVTNIPQRDASGELKPGGEDFHFSVKGPDGTAEVKCTAEQDAGIWRVTTITVQTSDGSTFIVPPPQTPSPEVRFDMPPTPDEIATPSETN